MKSLLPVALLACASAHAAPPFIEEMTSPEVRSYISRGWSTAILPIGSTEQNGPHMVLGKHNVVARETARDVAQRLGHTLVYPILPYAPTGDADARTGHMNHAGSVTVAVPTYAAVVRDLAASARASGFTTIVVLADHADGREILAGLVAELDRAWSADGVRVLHANQAYARTEGLEREFLRARGLEPGGHAGLADTAVLVYLDRRGTLVRHGSLPGAKTTPGVEGDPRGATASLGRALFRLKVQAITDRIREQLADQPRPRSRGM